MPRKKTEKKTHSPPIDKKIPVDELSSEELLKQLSQAVAEKNKLEAVLRTMDNGVYGVDWDGKLALFNKAAEKITGWKAEEVLNRYCQEVLQVKDDQGKSICDHCPLAQSFATGKTVMLSICSIATKSGDTVKVSSTYSSIKGLKNDVVSGIGVFRDLRKEEELEKMKADFVSLAAHELRTPITSIKGYLSVLIDEGKNFNSEQKMFLERSFLSANRLEALANNLLSVARIERGTIAINFIEFSLEDLIKESIEELLSRANSKKIGIKLRPPKGAPPKMFADREKIKQVLVNFISNSISYTPSGGEIRVSFSKKKNRAMVKVTDTGIGFGKETQKHLFQKFYREFGKTSPVQGTGLGLYISRMIIEMHHGEIWAKSKGRGKGSTFGFEIPIRQPGVVLKPGFQG